MSKEDGALDARIASRTALTEDIVCLELVALDGGPLPAFEAGAHVDVHVAPGFVRQYSISNDPRETHRYRLGILRDPASRGGSEAIHRAFEAGKTIRISLPRCNFRLAGEQRRAVLLAGGIGVTPLLSMAYCLEAGGIDFTLHYCTRTAARTAFRAELADAPFASRVVLHHDDGPPEQRLDLDAALGARDDGTHLYVCGPTGFIGFVTEGAKARGWGAGQIHVEHFTADVDRSGGSFTVIAAKSGVTVEVGPDESIAQALIRGGVDVPLSCEQGVCGTCLTDVVEGTPDHRDLYQTDEEKAANTQLTPCCSRSKSERLVLDL